MEKPPGVTMCRKGAATATSVTARTSSVSRSRAKPRSSTAPSASSWRGSSNRSGSIMEDNAESQPLAGAQTADAVTHGGAGCAARAWNRPMIDREDDGVALRQRHHLRPRLHARPLLGQHELAAGEVLAGPGQQDRHLQREDMLAIQV